MCMHVLSYNIDMQVVVKIFLYLFYDLSHAYNNYTSLVGLISCPDPPIYISAVLGVLHHQRVEKKFWKIFHLQVDAIEREDSDMICDHGMQFATCTLRLCSPSQVANRVPRGGTRQPVCCAVRLYVNVEISQLLL